MSTRSGIVLRLLRIVYSSYTILSEICVKTAADEVFVFWYTTCMSTKYTNIVLPLLVLIAAATGVFFYPSLPDTIVSHWNTAGEANGYMGKFWGVFLFPLIMLFTYGVYLLIPKIDPLKANIESFRKYYNAFWVLFSIFFLYIFFLSLTWNAGFEFDFSMALVPALAVFFFLIGVLLKHAKRNWFFGIRTPWTLSSDIVWDKTHQLGATLFKIIALVMLFGIAFPEQFIWFLIVPLFASVAYLLIYSYLEYQKLDPSQKNLK